MQLLAHTARRSCAPILHDHLPSFLDLCPVQLLVRDLVVELASPHVRSHVFPVVAYWYTSRSTIGDPHL